MPLSRSQVDHLWKVYLELGVMERHFGDAQLRCRALASTWLLAMFAGFGFLISKDPTLFKREILIASLGFISTSAIFSMWVIDLVIYQRLLDAAFIEGLSLEEAQPWLPQVRSNQRKLLKGIALARFSYFYAVAFGISYLIGCIGVTLSLSSKYSNSYLIFGIIILFVIIAIYLETHMLKETKSTKKYEDSIKLDRTNDYKTFERYREVAFSQNKYRKIADEE
jgi:hypothetical protein